MPDVALLGTACGTDDGVMVRAGEPRSVRTPPRPAAAGEVASGQKLSPVFTPARTPARWSASSAGESRDGGAAGGGRLLCYAAPSAGRTASRTQRAALLRRATDAAQQADPATGSRDRWAVVARVILTAWNAAANSLQLDERPRQSASQLQNSLAKQQAAACRCSAKALLKEREVLSGWLLQFEGVMNELVAVRAARSAASSGVSLELMGEAKRKERCVGGLVFAVQSKQYTACRAAEAERGASILRNRAALSEKVLAAEKYWLSCGLDVPLKLQAALCARRTTQAVAASVRLFEARERVACRIAAQARAEAEHGCSLADMLQKAHQLRAELAYMRPLRHGPPYRTLCGAGIA